jgi:polyisoprenoid-binding protein YceI
MNTTTTTAVRTYRVDTAHSEASFQVRHLLTKVRGRFSDFEGTIAIDEAHLEQSSATLTIRASSVDTNQPDRDAHLRSADFFAVEQFPTITFRSTRVAKTSENTFDVEGDLTIRGVSKAITVPVRFLGKAKDPWGNERFAFEAEYKINRQDFGLNWNAALETGGFLVGDEVKASISIQALAGS